MEQSKVELRGAIAAGICHKAIRPIIRLTFPRFADASLLHHFTYFPGQQLFNSFLSTTFSFYFLLSVKNERKLWWQRPGEEVLILNYSREIFSN